MPGNKALQNFIHKHLNRVERNLLIFCRQRDMKVLHQLRIDIKKINSLILFCDNCNKSNLRRQLKPLRKIFGQLAKMREAEINLQLGENMIKPILIEEQKQYIAEEWNSFVAKQKQYIRSIKKIRKYLFKHLRRVDRKNARIWFEKQLEQVEENLANTKYHNARKGIKHVLNVSLVYNGSPELNSHYLKSVESTLGSWHDINNCIATLKKKKHRNKKLKTSLVLKEQHSIADILCLTQQFKEKAFVTSNK